MDYEVGHAGSPEKPRDRTRGNKTRPRDLSALPRPAPGVEQPLGEKNPCRTPQGGPLEHPAPFACPKRDWWKGKHPVSVYSQKEPPACFQRRALSDP